MTNDKFKKLRKFATLAYELEQKESALQLFTQFSTSELGSSDKMLADIQSLKSEVSTLRNDYNQGLAEATTSIDSVTDTLIRVYMRLHYIRGLEWRDVAMLCHESSSHSVKSKVYRYLGQTSPMKGGGP